MASTPNFNWATPDNTGLVKNGALDIRTLGNAIDSSMADLKGGTTGQVLAKASNTDMDFVWAADAGAPTSYGFAAGKNKVINGDFGIWQRGTSFSLTGSTVYTADRWATYGVTGDTLSQQTFTPGTAPVAGYEGTFYARFVTGATASPRYFYQKIEDVRTFAGQTVTMSFWARVSSGTGTVDATLGNQNFGSGGSAFVGGTGQSFTATTSWQRFSFSAAVASVAGKTIGAGSFTEATLSTSNTSKTFEFWGVQLEAGSTVTQFQTATGSIQGELAACQRYYWRAGGSTAYQAFGTGIFESGTSAWLVIQNPVTMRTAPSSVDWSTIAVYDGGAIRAITGVPAGELAPNICRVNVSVASGGTQFRPVQLFANNSTSGYIGFSAEL